jgi:serine/threonine protein phosphatase PrpC
MEDRAASLTKNGMVFLGVYDGHGGTDASVFLQHHLLDAIHDRLVPGADVHDALTSAYLTVNSAFRSTGSIQVRRHSLLHACLDSMPLRDWGL